MEPLKLPHYTSILFASHRSKNSPVAGRPVCYEMAFPCQCVVRQGTKVVPPELCAASSSLTAQCPSRWQRKCPMIRFIRPMAASWCNFLFGKLCRDKTLSLGQGYLPCRIHLPSPRHHHGTRRWCINSEISPETVRFLEF